MGLSLGSFGFQSQSGGGAIPVLSYEHTQDVPADIWYVQHNLNAKCSVQVVDESSNEITARIKWVDNNNVEIHFNSPMIGYVYCNR